MALNHNTSHLQSMLAPCHTKSLIKRAESNVGSIVGFQQYSWPIEAQPLDRTQNYPGIMSTSFISSANVPAETRRTVALSAERDQESTGVLR